MTPEQIAGLCRLHAKDVQFPIGRPVSTLDPAKLLWAFAAVESSFGVNASPRHENGYCHGGIYFDAGRTKQWGCWAHCSYGPWQVMFSNFPPGVSPLMLFQPASDGDATAAELSCRAAIALLNNILKRATVWSLGDLARGYNGSASSDEYLAELATHYAGDMPAPVKGAY